MKKLILCVLLITARSVTTQNIEDAAFNDAFKNILNWKITLINRYKEPIIIQTKTKNLTIPAHQFMTITINDLLYTTNQLIINEPRDIPPDYKTNPLMEAVFKIPMHRIKTDSKIQDMHEIYFYYNNNDPKKIMYTFSKAANRVYGYNKGNTIKITLDPIHIIPFFEWYTYEGHEHPSKGDVFYLTQLLMRWNSYERNPQEFENRQLKYFEQYQKRAAGR